MKNLIPLFLICISISLCGQNGAEQMFIEDQHPSLFWESSEEANLPSNHTFENQDSPLLKAQENATLRNGETWLLDSIYSYNGAGSDWVFRAKNKTLTRDTCGNTLTSIGQNIVDSVLQDGYFRTYTYHDSSTINTIDLKSWNNSLNQWLDQDFAQYNEFGNIIYNETYITNPDGTPEYGFKTNWEYDVNQLLSERESYILDSLSQWVFRSNKTYTHYNNALLESDVAYVFGIPKDSFYYTYTTDDLLEVEDKFTWDTTVNNWIPRFRYTSTYNANGDITLLFREDWNTATNIWVDYSKRTYIYAPDNLSYSIESETKTVSQGWHKNNFREFYFDVNGHLLMSKFHTWDEDANDWKNFWEYFYSYDEYGNLLQSIRNDWNTDLTMWENGSRSDYYYSQNPVIINVEETPKRNVSIAPNPSNGYFSVDLEANEGLPESFQIFDPLGRKLLEKSITKQVFTLDLSFVPAGVYYILLSTGEHYALIKQ